MSVADLEATLPRTDARSQPEDAPGSQFVPSWLRRSAARVAVLVGFLLVWWLLVKAQIWDELILPSPVSVWEQFVNSLSVHDGQRGLANYYLYEHLGASFFRVLKGLTLAVLIGAPLGLLIGSVRWFGVVVGPYVDFVRALPPLAYFSLLIIWFGINDASKVWLLFLAAFPPITLSVASGVRGIPVARIHAAQSLGATRWQVVRTVVVPSVLPEFFTGLRLAVGFACTTVVAAETVNGIPGIGGLAWMTQKFLQTDVAILAVIVIGLCALALDLLIRATERRFVPWRGKS